MIPLSLTNRYARALFEAARANGNTDAVAEDVVLVDETRRASPALLELLRHPRLSHDDKERLLRKAFEGRVQEVTLEFLLLLLRKGRFEVLPLLAKVFERLLENWRNQLRIQVIAAFPFNEHERSFLKEKMGSLTGREILLDESVEPGLLGGLVIRFGDKQIDGSLRSHLQKLRTELKQTRVVAPRA
jgi:F-type H+-transporting ATPase subunit delta